MSIRKSAGRIRRTERRAAARAAKATATAYNPEAKLNVGSGPVSDPLSAATSITKEVTNQMTDCHADHEPGAETRSNNESQSGRTNFQKWVIGLLDAIGVGVCSVIANWLLSIGHKLLGTWFTFAAVITGMLLPALILHWGFPRSKWVWRAFCCVTGIVFLLFVWVSCQLRRAELAGVPQRETISFRIVAKAVLVCKRIEKAPFWLVKRGHGGELVRCPACTLMWVEFINLKPVSCMIDSYRVEMERGRGWEVATEMDLRNGGLFFALTDLKHAAVVDCRDNSFNFVIENRNIGPNETVHGWMLFESPTFGNLRLRVKDTSGNESVTAFEQASGASATNINTQI
jgi:hypothetical protein